MDVLLAIRNRRSCREYLQRPLEYDKITAVIEAGHYAPSAGNLQDWKYILVTDKHMRETVAEHCMEQHWMAHAPAMIIVCSNEERTEQHYGLRGKRLYSIQSCAAAVENMLLCAEALGIGACWVGAFDEEQLRDLFNIPQTARPQAIITLGYKATQPTPKELTSMDSCVYFGSYGNRLKKPHMAIRDFSTEWENQATNAKPALQKGLESIKQSVQKLKEQVNQQKRKK